MKGPSLPASGGGGRRRWDGIAGEQSGALGAVLERLADDLESRHALRAKVLGAMLYPAIVSVVALVIVIVLVTGPSLARFLAGGPTQDELDRAKTDIFSRVIRGAERIGGFDEAYFCYLEDLDLGMRGLAALTGTDGVGGMPFFSSPAGTAEFGATMLNASSIG